MIFNIHNIIFFPQKNDFNSFNITILIYKQSKSFHITTIWTPTSISNSTEISIHSLSLKFIFTNIFFFLLIYHHSIRLISQKKKKKLHLKYHYFIILFEHYLLNLSNSYFHFSFDFSITYLFFLSFWFEDFKLQKKSLKVHLWFTRGIISKEYYHSSNEPDSSNFSK